MQYSKIKVTPPPMPVPPHDAQRGEQSRVVRRERTPGASGIVGELPEVDQ